MGKGLSIAGMVLGIVSIVSSFVFFWASIPCAIVGLVLSVVGGKKLKANNMPRGMATAGLVLSIVSLALGALMTACGVCAICALEEAAGLL